MKQIIFYTLIGLCFFSCKRADDAFKSYGKDVTIERKVGVFTKIFTGDKFDVVLVQDSLQAGKILITAGENVIDGYETIVRNGELRIENKNKFNWVRKLKVRQKVVVFFKEIEFLSIQSSAKITCVDSIVSDKKIIIDHGGLEDASLNIVSDYLYVNCTNTGGVFLKGKAFLLSASIDDISFLNAINFLPEKAYLSSFSLSNSSVVASEVLEITNHGDATIFYKEIAGAQIKNTNYGKGKIVKVN